MHTNSGDSELQVTLANLPSNAEYLPDNSLNRYILCTYCVLITILGTGARAANKTDKVPVLVALDSPVITAKWLPASGSPRQPFSPSNNCSLRSSSAVVTGCS